jgi:hypothetical protein
VTVLGWTSAAALAYETDQLVWRDHQLRDASGYADALMAEVLARSVAAVNARSACGGTDDELRLALARALHDHTSRRVRVVERGAFRSPGFGTFTAALERTDRVDRFAFSRREDLYGSLTVWHSLILTVAGPCSTLEVGGVRTGTDKFDHFLDTGYHYFREVLRRGDDDAGVVRGTATERAFYGLLTSKAFSYADLRANWDGLRFYQGLLGDGSAVRRDEAGCLEVARPFTWREWVSPEWDEVLNPPVYTRLVERGVLRALEDRRTEVCAARERWDHERWREAALESLPEPAPYVIGPAPGRRDPWQLEALCDPGREEALSASPVRPRREVRALRHASEDGGADPEEGSLGADEPGRPSARADVPAESEVR